MSAALKPRKQPIQDRSARMVEAIVEAAICILRRDGRPQLTTTRVAARAGVSVGSLYQYFPNREAIAVEIVRQRTRGFLESVLAVDFAGASDLGAAVHRAMAAFAKFMAVTGVRPDATRLAVALAVIEGAVWEALAQDAAALDRPASVDTFARLFMAALGDVSS